MRRRRCGRSTAGRLFRQIRELRPPRAKADCAIEVDGNSYSVPWRFIGESVQVVVADGRVSIRHAEAEIAVHAETSGRRQRIVEPAHFHGVAGAARPVAAIEPVSTAEPTPALLRPLAGVRERRRWRLVMTVDHETLTGWLTRLKAHRHSRSARQPHRRSGAARAHLA